MKLMNERELKTREELYQLYYRAMTNYPYNVCPTTKRLLTMDNVLYILRIILF